MPHEKHSNFASIFARLGGGLKNPAGTLWYHCSSVCILYRRSGWSREIDDWRPERDELPTSVLDRSMTKDGPARSTYPLAPSVDVPPALMRDFSQAASQIVPYRPGHQGARGLLEAAV
jgi:hypothetical protein